MMRMMETGPMRTDILSTKDYGDEESEAAVNDSTPTDNDLEIEDGVEGEGGFASDLAEADDSAVASNRFVIDKDEDELENG